MTSWGRASVEPPAGAYRGVNLRHGATSFDDPCRRPTEGAWSYYEIAAFTLASHAVGRTSDRHGVNPRGASSGEWPVPALQSVARPDAVLNASEKVNDAAADAR
jgi:hypothetical protein